MWLAEHDCVQVDKENNSCHLAWCTWKSDNVPWNKFCAEVGDRAQQFILSF